MLQLLDWRHDASHPKPITQPLYGYMGVEPLDFVKVRPSSLRVKPHRSSQPLDFSRLCADLITYACSPPQVPGAADLYVVADRERPVDEVRCFPGPERDLGLNQGVHARFCGSHIEEPRGLKRPASPPAMGVSCATEKNSERTKNPTCPHRSSKRRSRPCRESPSFPLTGW